MIETEQHLENEKYLVDADFPKAIRMQWNSIPQIVAEETLWALCPLSINNVQKGYTLLPISLMKLKPSLAFGLER